MTILYLKRTGKHRQLTTAPWVVLIAVILLTGCSKTQWLYGNADWMLERYAVKALDLNDAQLKNWHPVLEQVLQQHLEREIPLLVEYLELMARAVNPSPRETVNADCLVRSANLIFSRHARLAADLAAPILAQLDSRQIDHLTAYLTRRSSSFSEINLQGDKRKRQQARAERITRRIEKWTGALNSSQQARIEQFTLNLPDVTASWFEHRKRQEERLLRLLSENADAESLRAHLLNWWIPWSKSSPEFAAQWRQAETLFVRLLEDLAASLSERQKQHFVIEVTSLKKEIAELNDETNHVADYELLVLQCGRHRI